MLEFGPQSIPQVLGEWICIITRDSGLLLLGRDDYLSLTGVNFIRSLWLRLERLRPSKKIGLWRALRSGSGWCPQLKLEGSRIRPIERLKVPLNTLVVLNDSAPAVSASSRVENLELVICVNLSSTSAEKIKEIAQGKLLDPHSLKGTVDVLIGETLTRLGSSDESLFLLSSLERFANAIEQLRTAGTNVEVVLMGDAPSVWFVRRIKDMSHVYMLHGALRTAAVTVRALDAAMKEAVSDFLARLLGALPLDLWPERARAVFEKITIAWPELDALRTL